MTIIVRDKKDSAADLTQALDKLIPLLKNQGEDDAITDLEEARKGILKSAPGTESFRSAVTTVIQAFEGDHDLMVYTYQRKSSEWTEAEELALVSSRVLNLARRMKLL